MALVKVIAEMPGMVSSVSVREGQKVCEGDTLLTLESMKMEVPLLAPQSGMAKEIRVKVGDVIMQGHAAVIIEV